MIDINDKIFAKVNDIIVSGKVVAVYYEIEYTDVLNKQIKRAVISDRDIVGSQEFDGFLNKMVENIQNARSNKEEADPIIAEGIEE